MPRIRITPDQVRGVAQQFRSAAQQSEQTVNALTSTINGLQSDWEGMSQAKFYQDFQFYQAEMRKFIELLLGIASNLETIAYNFEQADQAAATGPSPV